MNALQTIFSEELIEAIGWTLIHSLWQGALIVIVLAIMLILMRKNSAQLKYFVSFIALLLIVGWSSITFVNSYKYAKEKASLKESITSNPGYIKSLLQQTVNDDKTKLAGEQMSLDLKMVKYRSFFQRNFNTICSIWLLGMALLMVRMVGGFIYARRLRTYQLIEIDEKWLSKIHDFAEKLSIKRKVSAFFSPLANSPLTLGTFKPILLFPVAAFTGLSTKDIEAILAHELAHVLRHDYFFNVIQSLIEILFFYHPAVWIISTQIRNERENSCDNIAIELTGDKVAYVKALAQIQLNHMEEGQLAMAFASQRSSVLQRIKRLQKKVAMKTNFIEGLIAAGVIVIGLTLVSFTVGNNVHTQLLPDESINQNEFDNLLSNSSSEKSWSVYEVDSIRDSMEENISKAEELENVSEELEQAIEVALSENDGELSAEIMEEINAALRDINVGEIIQEAMYEVENALNDIDMEEIINDVKADVDYDEILRDMEEAQEDIREARREIEHAKADIDKNEIREDLEEARRDIEEARWEMRQDMQRDMRDDNVPEEIIELSIKAAEAGLNVASSVLENLPIDDIIDAALTGAEAALEAIEDIDFDEVFEDIDNDIKNEISEKDLDRLKEQLEQKEEEIERAKEKLKEKEKELKKKSKEK